MRPLVFHLSKTIFLGAFLALFCGVLPAFSEEETLPVPASSPSSLNPALQEKIARWKELREKDPAAFEQKVREHKGRLKGRLQEFQQKNPEKFEQFKERFVERRRERMQNLRRENPEKFQQVMKNREQRFDRWKEKNPEKYNQFVENHPQFKERLQNRENRNRERENFRGLNPEERREKFQSYAKEHPEEAKQFLENHPRAQQRLQNAQAQNPQDPAQNGAPEFRSEKNQQGQNFQPRGGGFRNPPDGNSSQRQGPGMNRNNFGGQRPAMNRPQGPQQGQGPSPQGMGPRQGNGAGPMRDKRRN